MSGGKYQRGVPREEDVDPRKYEVGRLLTFAAHNQDGPKSQFKVGDVVRVMFRCTNHVVGGIDVVRTSDGLRDFVFPEEVSVRRAARARRARGLL